MLVINRLRVLGNGPHTPNPIFLGITLPSPPDSQTDRHDKNIMPSPKGDFYSQDNLLTKILSMPEFFLSKELTSLVIMTQFLTVFPYSLCRFEKMSTDKKEKKFV